MRPFEDVLASLKEALENYILEHGLSKNAFARPLRVSRSCVIDFLNHKDRSVSMFTLFAFIETYGFDAVGEEFTPTNGLYLHYEVAHDRMCDNILAFMKRGKWSTNAFTIHCGLGYDSVRQIFVNDRDPNLFTMWAIANGMGCETIGDLYSR